VIGSELDSAHLQTQNGTNYETLNPQTVKIKVNEDTTLSLIDQNHRISRIVVSDLRAKNGIVHVVNKVMLPSTQSTSSPPNPGPNPGDDVLLTNPTTNNNDIVTALSTDTFSIFNTALNTAGLTEMLSTNGPFTVFAPNNNAFYALFNRLGITQDEFLQNANLYNLLSYHILSGYGFMFKQEELLHANNMLIKTENGESIKVVVDDQENNIALIDKNENTANIVSYDFFSNNGVVHEIDNVLIYLPDLPHYDYYYYYVEE